ncbi:MAG: hypothetical protein LBT13_03295 [Treponema sp.]|jgi:hypothetical protein|nr:hypothetical protein [Treponema sp.]
MKIWFVIRVFAMLAGTPLLTASCGGENAPVVFPFSTNYPVEVTTLLYALSPNAAQGLIPLAQPQSLEYVFKNPLKVLDDYSLELAYGVRVLEKDQGKKNEKKTGKAVVPSLQDLAARYQLVLAIDGDATWELPLDLSFLGIEDTRPQLSYAVPLNTALLGKFSITWAGLEVEQAGSATGGAGLEDLVFELDAISLVTRWYGFDQEGRRHFVTPFVYQEQTKTGVALILNPPAAYRNGGAVELRIRGLERAAQAMMGQVRFEYAGSATKELFIPAGAVPAIPYPVIITPGSGIHGVKLLPVESRDFPGTPIPADPGLILDYPQTSWRAPAYEVFQWEDFPSVLIFDTRSYEVQDRLFKRLAFYTEKRGFRGRLAEDEEIAGLHGWNAHDYRAEDLAAFFEAARLANFPLLKEEQELEDILFSSGIIQRTENAAIRPGTGAVISISRESPAYLRSQFMVHEGFHGIFFIDPEFRAFSRRRWENLPSVGKRFILSFFDYQQYDIKDEYLTINEFMAHCLQQSVSQSAKYFGETLAARIDASSWRRTVLPPKDEATGSWPELTRIFRIEAEAFSAYVTQRWGLAAGRIRQVTVR